MLSRSRFALVWIALTTLLPALSPQAATSLGAAPMVLAPAATTSASGEWGAGAADLARSADDAPLEAAVVAADYPPLTTDLRVPERVELASALARVQSTRASMSLTHARRAGATVAPAADAMACWSDVVQCRRQLGARLLCYATAPPAHA